MKKHIAGLSGLSLSLLLFACDNSKSSDDAAAETPATAVTGPGADAAAGQADPSTPPAEAAGTTEETPTSDPGAEAGPVGELQDVIALNSNYLEYSRLQYDCGDIAVPLDAATVETNLKGAKSFQTLAATIPAKDQALVKISAEENGVSCTYRAIFSVNKSFTEVTYNNSQALNPESVTACANSKAAIDLGFGTDPVAFDYDKKFIRWVALHIPVAMQVTPLCPNGKLRAVFSGASL